MSDGSMLKVLGTLFYLTVALCAGYGVWDFFRRYRRINSTAAKTCITAHKLLKMVDSRAR